MGYLVLARKYRPLLFSDVVAQEHVTRTLVNAIGSERISHAYLFSGPRGVGKTTTARILARAVNCRESDGPDPCNECETCREIIAGRSMDILEIDGASNRGIDEIRELRERVGYAPSSSRYKIYIIDEVHMLTQEAFNALLKTLEEPPSHVIFIFATTAPHKVPPTILSRCQRFDFKAVPTSEIISRLETVLAGEEVEMDRQVVEMIARKADGAMRDALSLTDQVLAFCDGDYTVERAARVLGVLDAELFFRLTGLISSRDSLGVVRFVDELVDSGVDLEEFYAELVRHYRNMIVLALGTRDPSALDIPLARAESYAELAGGFRVEDLVRGLQLALSFEEMIKFSGQQKISLELLLIRLTMLDDTINISDLLARLESGRPAGTAGGDGGRGLRRVEDSRGGAGKTPERARPTQSGQVPENTGRKPQEEQTAGRKGRLDGLDTGDGALEIETLKQRWPELVGRIKEKRRALGALLSSSEPGGFENGTLELKVAAEPFNLDRLRNDQQRKFICEMVMEAFGLESLKLEVVAAEPAPGGPDVEQETDTNPAAHSFEELCRSDKLMGKIRELFDPELIPERPEQ